MRLEPDLSIHKLQTIRSCLTVREITLWAGIQKWFISTRQPLISLLSTHRCQHWWSWGRVTVTRVIRSRYPTLGSLSGGRRPTLFPGFIPVVSPSWVWTCDTLRLLLGRRGLVLSGWERLRDGERWLNGCYDLSLARQTRWHVWLESSQQSREARICLDCGELKEDTVETF